MEIVFNSIKFNYIKTNDVLQIKNQIIQNQKITLISGKNNSGKSTVGELIVGNEILNSGEIIIGGQFYSSSKNDVKHIKREVGLINQYAGESIFARTIEEEILFSAKNYNIKEAYPKMEEYLKFLKLDYLDLSTDPTSLSNGEQKLISIIAVLISDPKIIIFDEPLLGLDFNKKRSLIILIRNLKVKENKTVIIISNDINELYEFIDEVIILKNQKIFFSGSKNKLYKECDNLIKNDISIPTIVSLNRTISNKEIILDLTDNIDDFIKAVYRAKKN